MVLKVFWSGDFVRWNVELPKRRAEVGCWISWWGLGCWVAGRNESRELEWTTYLNSKDQNRPGFLTIPRPYIALFLAYYR